MKTQKVQIETIKLDPSNPRSITKEAFESLKKSITDFPEMQSVKPLVVADGYALAGNMRLLAYKDLGYRELHVLDVSEWSQAKRDEFMIKDNTHYGTWDYDALANEWETLPLTDWGLDVWEPEVEEIKGLTDEDDVPEAPQEPITKLGDVWILGEHRVMCGDSTSKEAVEILMDGVISKLMVTDPPYGVSYDPSWRNKALRENGKPVGARAIGKVMNDNNADWRKAWELFSGDVVYVWHGGLHAHTVADSLIYCGFELKSQIIWAKSNFAIGRSHYHWKHEPCWYAVRKGKSAQYEGDRKQNTIWEISKPSKSETGHGTQKPVECMERPIRHNSQQSDLIYDPFLGSGSTLIAAEKTNRKCYGMELDPKYCDVIVKRWEEFTGKKAHLEENEFEVITQAH